MYSRVDICFSLAVSAKQRECLRLPSSPPIPPVTLFQPCGFSLNFLAQNKVLYEGGLFLLLPGLAWSQAEQKSLTNRSALARLPAKLRGLAMLVETQVLSTLPPGSPNLHPPYLSPQPLPPSRTSSFPQWSYHPLWVNISYTLFPGALNPSLAKTKFSGTKGTRVQG